MSTKHIIDNLLIVGGGLIGSSVARACKANGTCETVTVFDIDPEVNERVAALGIADEIAADLGKSAANADLVILAVPPGKMGKVAQEISPFLKRGSIVTDVGSIKTQIIEAVEPHIPEGVSFIGGHPIAGTEKSGPDAGFATLFVDRWCILTPHDSGSDAAKKLKSFWESLGSMVEFMDPERHDLVLATTSHLPHLIAYALVGTATDMETVTRSEVVKYSAGGFRDFTRIAASDPKMWRDVFLGNREGVLEVLGRYIEDLTALKKAIRWSDGEVLLKEFSKTGEIRRKIIDAGQDSAAPNFGRDQPEDQD